MNRRNSRPLAARPVAEALEARQLLAAFDVLVFSKTQAFRHDSIPAGIQAIRQLGTANDFTVTATENAADFTDANLAQYEAVVFLMTTGDVLDATQQAAFERYVRTGGGYVGVHSASDTEYAWPWYGNLVGAYFSNHPAIQQATIKVADRAHPATAHLPQRWVRTDEWYSFRTNPRGRVHVLATLDESTYSGGTMGFDHPIAWCQEYDGGRSFYTGTGHTAATYSEAAARQHLLGGIQWAAGAVPGDAGATVDANFRKTVLDDNTLDPFQLDVAADGRVFFVERAGAVKVWSPQSRATTLLARVPVALTDEDGMMGLALDPNFATNNWLYLFYSAPAVNEQHVSRFTVAGGTLDRASERVLLRIPIDRGGVNHSGGSLSFGPDGSLYASTGDNTNPFGSDGFAPIDERAGREKWDAQRSAANANDLRGKVLRITPQDDGSYTIPEGNLFPADGSNGPGRPEIYTMGNRNPFRISVDPETGWLYWGEVGPDATFDSASRGPAGHDEFNQARSAGNYGWPYFVADNKPYVDFNFATATSGEPSNPAAPLNDSPNNSGRQDLPPARPAWMWYPYGPIAQFPEFGSGGRTAMAGPVFHSDRVDAATASPYRLPAYYDDTLFVYEWSRNWIREVKLDASGNVLKINPFAAGVPLARPMDMKIGPDGAVYLIEWGTGFGGGNADSRLVRIDYLNNPTQVLGRHVFYNNSSFDGANPAPNAADDAAIAPDKTALRPGQPATAANVTSYLRGINGVMIDVANLPAGVTPTADDFGFRSGGGADPATFTAGPLPVVSAVRRGAGALGSDRITLVWRDFDPRSAIANQAVANGWLEVTFDAGNRTGLSEPDVFYFGNLIADTGDDAGGGGPLVVNALDLAAVKRSLNSLALVTSPHDVNRDGRVNALDLAAVRARLGSNLPLLTRPGLLERRVADEILSV